MISVAGGIMLCPFSLFSCTLRLRSKFGKNIYLNLRMNWLDCRVQKVQKRSFVDCNWTITLKVSLSHHHHHHHLVTKLSIDMHSTCELACKLKPQGGDSNHLNHLSDGKFLFLDHNSRAAWWCCLKSDYVQQYVDAAAEVFVLPESLHIALQWLALFTFWGETVQNTGPSSQIFWVNTLQALFYLCGQAEPSHTYRPLQCDQGPTAVLV